MSKKSLILCLSVLGGVLILIGIAIAVLYSGAASSKSDDSDDLPSVLSAVPSDAMLLSLGKVRSLCDLNEELEDLLKRCDAAVSLHYSGNLYPLYVLDVRKVDAPVLDQLKRYLTQKGMSVSQNGDIFLYSCSENLVKSAVRHIDEGVCIKDATGFVDAFNTTDAQNSLFISGLHARRLLSSAFTRNVYKYSTFVSKVADWYAFEVEDSQGISLDGNLLYGGEPDELMTAFKNCIPGVSKVADYLPSYTLFAVTVPVQNHSAFRKDFQAFADSRNSLKTMLAQQESLKSKNGIAPMELFDNLEVQELATAGVVIRSRLERINLIHISNKDAELIFRDPALKTLRGYVPKTHEWKYGSYLSSVYGSMFALPDESCFTYMDGWLIIGSRTAIDEYVTKNALGYTLSEYTAHAGRKNLLSESEALAVAYFSLTAEKDRLTDYINRGFIKGLRAKIGEPEYSPAVIYIGKDREGSTIDFEIGSLALSRTKAPTESRDTVVVVSKGPFKVVNSHTGKTNTFYQNKYKSLCLRDENGRDLWGIPFDKTICGTAHNVDIYDNGNLQIIFGAGNCIYVIDRLGRYVGGFPLELKKEICLGPDIYEISGKQCALVLHKDNTLEIYDMKGKKLSSWKTIDLSKETIKSLPTKLTVGDKDYWIVRTSIQTLIYPFEGGKPLTKFKDDSKIKPGSQVLVTEDQTAVEVDCYDGKRRTVKLN
jgi:hypothetical protein